MHGNSENKLRVDRLEIHAIGEGVKKANKVAEEVSIHRNERTKERVANQIEYYREHEPETYALIEKSVSISNEIAHLESARLDLPIPEHYTDLRIEDISRWAGGELGRFDVIANEVAVNVKPYEKFPFKTFLHESVHRWSFQKVYVEESSLAEMPSALRKRGGYMSDLVNRGKRPDSHTLFVQFNEGVTELYTQQLIARYGFSIRERIGEEATEYVGTYATGVRLVQAIVAGVAKSLNKNEQDVFDDIVRGMLTGNMMHLRLISKVYGRQALEILAGVEMPYDEDKKMSEALRFFSAVPETP